MRTSLYFILAILIGSCSNRNTNSDAANSDQLIESNTILENNEAVDIEKSIDENYYDTGEIKQTIEYHENGSGFKYTEFWKNGKRKTLGEQGNLLGCGIPVGKEQHFDESENLLQTITYDHFFRDSESCHQIRTVKTITDYYVNGNIEKSGNIETCYECSECPCGKWLYYDENGKLIKNENFGDCYDSQLGCTD